MPEETAEFAPEIRAIEQEVDDLLEKMQTPGHEAGVAALFRATGEELGRAARNRAVRGQ